MHQLKSQFIESHPQEKQTKQHKQSSQQDPIVNYFNKIQSQISETSKAKNYNQQVHTKINKQLQNNILEISQQQRAFTLRSKYQKVEPPKLSEEQMLRNLEEQKKDTLDKLRQIQRQEFTLKYKSRNKSMHILNTAKTIKAPNNQHSLTKLVKAHKQFQQNLKYKTKKAIELYLQQAKHQQSNENEQIRKKQQEHKIMVLNHMKSLELRHQQRKNLKKIIKGEIRNLKNKQYIHQDLQKKFRERLNEQQRDYQKQIEKIKQRNKFDINAIHQHQYRYQQLIQRYREKKNKSQQTKIQHKSYEDNYFSRLAKMQSKQFKEKEHLGYEKSVEIKSKIAKYQEFIDNQIRPNIKKSRKLLPLAYTPSLQSLTNQQLRQKGNQYMIIAKKLKKSKQQLDNKPDKPKIKTGIQYIDYLKEQRRKSHYDPAERQFSTLVKHNNIIEDYDSANKAFYLAEQMNAKTKKLKDEKMYYSAKNKLDLLSVLI